MSKKIMVAIFSILLVAILWFQSQKSVFSGLDGKITYYTASRSSNAKMIASGSRLFVFDRTGESIEIDEKMPANEILKKFNAKLVFSEKTENGVSYYAYSSELKYQTELVGKPINLHIHCENDRTVIGTPIIFGSF
jgi:hypothetical protein